jgi:MSHA biogenesis protein MshI
VRTRAQRDGNFEVLQLGVERQGGDTLDAFVSRLTGLGLKGCNASVMLRPEQYHLLQIPAPSVPAEELKAAARYQIREMVDIHIDDLTLDVMYVGDGQQKNNPQLFVVAATTADVRAVMDLASAMDWPVTVIDIQETCQRNLQTALAQRAGTPERADACLVLTDEQHALITICAKGELYYTRRLELPEGFLTMAWTQAESTIADAPDGYTPVTEYVPDYAGTPTTTGALSAAQSDADRAQRVVVEVQRSLDLWDRSWSSLPLSGLRVYAGERSAELATWLSRETGQAVTVMDLDPLFTGLPPLTAPERSVCLPLLGLLLRLETSVA